MSKFGRNPLGSVCRYCRGTCRAAAGCAARRSCGAAPPWRAARARACSPARARAACTRCPARTVHDYSMSQLTYPSSKFKRAEAILQVPAQT